MMAHKEERILICQFLVPGETKASWSVTTGPRVQYYYEAIVLEYASPSAYKSHSRPDKDS